MRLISILDFVKILIFPRKISFPLIIYFLCSLFWYRGVGISNDILGNNDRPKIVIGSTIDCYNRSKTQYHQFNFYESHLGLSIADAMAQNTTITLYYPNSTKSIHIGWIDTDDNFINVIPLFSMWNSFTLSIAWWGQPWNLCVKYIHT